MKKLAFLISHPIQYNSPLFVELAKSSEVDLEVLYCSDEGTAEIYDKGFKQTIVWDIPLLEGYKYKFLKNNSFRPGISQGFLGLLNFGVIQELRKNKYDAIIVHSWHYATHVLAIIIASLFSIQLYIRIEWPIAHEKKKPKWKFLLKKLIVKTLFRKANFLAVGKNHSEGLKYYGVPESRIIHFPYAVDNKRFKDDFNQLSKQRENLRTEFGFKKNDVVLIFVGKLISKKRPFDALKVLEKLNQDNLHLLYVGEGELNNQLRDYVNSHEISNVHFVGFKNQTELAPFYVMSDIFVLPSGIGETWGLVVNEAMCFGLPVVVSDLVGCGRDLVRDGENGFIYPYANLEELGEYIRTLSLDSEMRKKYGAMSKLIIESYSYKTDVESLIRALN